MLKRPKRSYSPEVIANALTTVKANNGNLSKSARELDIPFHTLREWVKNGRRNTAEVSVIQQIKEGTLAQKLELNAHRLADSITDHDLKDVSLQQKAITLAITTEKMLLLNCQPTAIHAQVMTEDERQLRLAELLHRAAERANSGSQQAGKPVPFPRCLPQIGVPETSKDPTQADPKL